MSSFLDNNFRLHVSNPKTDNKRKVTFGDTVQIEDPLINPESNFKDLESNYNDSEAESNKLIFFIVVFGCFLAIIILLILYKFNLLKN